MTRVFVIDTSYLLELFAVPGHSTLERTEAVRRKFGEAASANARLFVPTPCVFEVAKHVAGVSNGNARKRLARKLRESVHSSINEGIPWVTLSTEHDELPQLCAAFENHATQHISLTDTCVIQEAVRLKQKYSTLGEVHIWTTDSTLKAHEPDTESDPFLGGG